MSLAGPLKRLEACLINEKIYPLEGQDYTRTHRAFEAASTQRQLIGSHLLTRAEELHDKKGRRMHVCSAGCGDGGLDMNVISGMRDKLERFVGFDPNPSQISAFRGLSGADHRVELRTTGDPDSLAGQLFDFVYSIHVIYYVADIKAFITSLCRLAGPEGLVMVGIAPFGAMNQIANALWRVEEAPVGFSDDFGADLKRWNIDASCKRIMAELPLEFVSGSDASRDIIDFLVQAKTSDMSEDAQTALDEAFIESSVLSNSQRVIPHPVDMWSFSGV